MWIYLVRHILRYRLINLIVIIVLTGFMGYHALKVQMSYEFSSLLPASDTAYIAYENFKERFGKDGSVLFIGIKDDQIFSLNKFDGLYDLSYDLKKIDGVEECLSLARIFNLTKNDSLKKFEFSPVLSKRPESQEEVDSIKNIVYSLPFYEGRMFNSKTNVSLLALTLDDKKLNTKKRIDLVSSIKDRVDQFSEDYNIEVHYSGLPYIRTITSKKLEDESKFFVVLAMVIASIILFIFFRSFMAVLFPMLIVVISLVWVFGTMSLLDFKVTMLTAVFPPLLIVIVVENCIFLLNKYYNEYRSHGNKIRSLSRVVQRIGNANLLTNATTAAGFAAFLITGNKLLVEFGVIASINIMVAYILSLFLIPIFYSFLPSPRERHVKHLEKSVVARIIPVVVRTVTTKRTYVYSITVVILVIAFFGMTRLQTTGKIVDDIPRKDELYKDLLFIEKHFKGVMPLEFSIDSKKPKGIQKLSTIQKIDDFENVLATYPELSSSLSIAEVLKFAKQAFYNGNEKMYSLPNNNEKNFILRYMPQGGSGQRTILNSFIDTSLRYARISTQMANIGTYDIERIQNELRPQIDSIFPTDKFDVAMTGTSVVFLKGSQYLVKNLFTSLLLALVIITILMALLFTSIRMIIISLIPNIIPLLMTAAMMGYIGIPIKPSTVLIFSIALGISVDNAIHFLSRYRLQLKINDWKIRESAISALKETGFSMIYSSVVLFFGFIIFVLSSFGGTESLGYLIAFTLVVALLSNLFILPSLILSLDKWITTKTFKEPLLEIFDEEEDIELGDLEIEQIDTRGSA
ncbi:MAG TPA: efflux RND transporter permease subunit [Bacteroidales bacterium]|nr:MMPL family transporter [Bacteroidales bacterium]HPE57946.1 efflux RND transporter permease subunit [Bacteroidales bacterium]HRX96171.1 efflux RND transporter permease subunit [Bacteroidales bacterium]